MISGINCLSRTTAMLAAEVLAMAWRAERETATVLHTGKQTSLAHELQTVKVGSPQGSILWRRARVVISWLI